MSGAAGRPDPGDRLRFLAETVSLEAEHLRTTDARLFAEPMDAARAHSAVPLLEHAATSMVEALRQG